MNIDRHILLLKKLSSRGNKPDKNVLELFNIYLDLAVQHNSFKDSILTEISLFNRCREWKTPDKLTWSEQENIVSDHHLDKDQEVILQSYLEALELHVGKDLAHCKEHKPPSKTSNYEVLKDYFYL